jgi:hypothetical protein
VMVLRTEKWMMGAHAVGRYSRACRNRAHLQETEIDCIRVDTEIGSPGSLYQPRGGDRDSCLGSNSVSGDSGVVSEFQSNVRTQLRLSTKIGVAVRRARWLESHRERSADSNTGKCPILKDQGNEAQRVGTPGVQFQHYFACVEIHVLRESMWENNE